MEYRITNGWRIVALFGSLVLLGSGIWLLVLSFHPYPPAGRIFLSVTGSLLLFLCCFGTIETIRSRLVIDERAITVYSGHVVRELLLTDIEGYRIDEKGFVYLIPREAAGIKTIKINAFPYLENKKILLEWIQDRYPNADILEEIAEQHRVLTDEQFGATEEQRMRYLIKARKAGTFAGIAGFVPTVWAIIYPHPYEWLCWLLIILPWIGVYLTWYFKGLMRLDSGKGNPYPTALLLMIMPAMGLVLLAVLRYDIYHWQAVWQPLTVITVTLTLLFYAACRKTIAATPKKAAVALCVLIFSAIYGYGLLVNTNCYYDTSSARIYSAEVKNKREEDGKRPTYYLTLSAWGELGDGEEFTVSRETYNKVLPGEKVSVELREGKWGIPWYRITEH